MTDKPIEVSANAGNIDMLTAALRYLIVILGAVPAILSLLGDRNFYGLIEYLQGQDGVAVVAAVTALGTLIYGLVKTRRRGAEVATVAADPRVPNAVAQIK